MEVIDVSKLIKCSKKRFIWNLVFVSLFFIICLTADLLLLFLSNNNYLIPLIIAIIITSICLVGLIFYFGNIFPLVRHYYSFSKRLATTTNIRKRVMTYEKEIENKIKNGVTYRQFIFSYSDAGKNYYDKIYILDADTLEFETSKSYTLFTFENTLIKFEEQVDAETK